MKKEFLYFAVLLAFIAVFTVSCTFVPEISPLEPGVIGDSLSESEDDGGSLPVTRSKTKGETPSENGKIYVNKITDRITSDDGKTLIELNITYPRFADAAESVNEYIKKIAEDIEAKVDGYAADALNLYTNDPFFVPYRLEMTYDIVYLNDKTVSLKIQKFYYLGGAHGSSEYIGVTFNTESEDILSAEQISGLDSETLKKEVIAGFEAVIEKNPSDFYENAKQEVSQNYENLTYYLTENGLAFLFQEYVIAPYSAGPVEFILPL